MAQLRAAPLWQSGLLCRCPRCGKGKLYAGFLDLRPSCDSCGLDYAFIDAGDGPAIFIIMLAGAIVVTAALIVEIKYQPPFWLHAALWLPLTVILTLLILPSVKGALIALQWALRMHGFDPEAKEDIVPSIDADLGQGSPRPPRLDFRP